MPKVTLKYDSEPFEKMLNRWKRLVDKADTLKDYYKHEMYEKPSIKRTRRKAAAIKRWERKEAELNTNRPMA